MISLFAASRKAVYAAHGRLSYLRPPSYRSKTTNSNLMVRLTNFIPPSATSSVQAPIASVVTHRKGVRAGERTLIIKVPISGEKIADIPFLNLMVGPPESVSNQALKLKEAEDFECQAIKREIIYNLYLFLSYTRIASKESAPGISRRKFADMVAEAPQLSLLTALLVSRGSSLTSGDVLMLLNPKIVAQMAEGIHKCTLKMALQTAEALKNVDSQGPLLLPAILLIIGRDSPPNEGDPILNKKLERLRDKHYKLSLNHNPFTKQMKRRVNQQMAERTRGSLRS